MTENGTPLLVVRQLTKCYTRSHFGGWSGGRKPRVVRAVNDVSFCVSPGNVLGIVGESGSGKTTLARLILRLERPTSGTATFLGRDVHDMTSADVFTHLRPRARMVFQHPDAVLNPAYPVGLGLANSMRLHGTTSSEKIPDRIEELLTRVGLNPSFSAKYPDELSGGEKRRIGICRALSTNPDLIIADEPLSGLDVVLQERILALLQLEQQARGFALILVSHDLDRVNQVCDRVLVMFGGQVMEELTLRRGSTPVHEQFVHPYSVVLQRARVDLDSSAPAGDDDATIAAQRAQSESGCSFRSICPLRRSLGSPALCDRNAPALVELAQGHRVACHFTEEAQAGVELRDNKKP